MQKMSEKEAIEWLKAISATQKESIHMNSLLNRKEALHMAIQALEEIRQYKEIGTVEELKTMKENGAFSGNELTYIAMNVEKLRKYQAIGTHDQCREAVERMKPKKPIKEDSGCYDYDFDYKCPTCEEYIDDTADTTCCGKCGQAIDWEE